jgi:acyl-CoA oxidase
MIPIHPRRVQRRSVIFLFALQNLHKRHFLGHSDQYLLSADRAVAFHKACFRLGITDTHEMYWTSFQIGIAPLPTDVHMSMFIPTLETQSSPAQRRYWVPLARNFAILVCALEPTPPCLPSAVPLSDLRPDYSLQGAYAQTELGHGSNVRGIETMATYDPATQSFDLHSPTEASTKWWPGGLGKTATHAVVYARLLLKGRDMGLHAFIVELRDPATHRSLPGIELGDIGPKLGFNTVDNGYARFSHVRVPLEHLLQGFCSLTPAGEYARVGDARLGYASMLHVRWPRMLSPHVAGFAEQLLSHQRARGAAL